MSINIRNGRGNKMKTVRELGTFTTEAYKGYLITFNALQNLYYVLKDNCHIYSNASLSDVRLNIDLLVD